jgi:hypothetical protein
VFLPPNFVSEYEESGEEELEDEMTTDDGQWKLDFLEMD